MSTDFNVTAETRKDVGKGASRRLRHAGKIPGVIYGGGKDALSLTMDHDEVLHQLENEAFYSHVLSVKVDDKTEKAVLKDVQRHPSKPKIMHVDFQRVSETEKIHMHVPLHFINEEIAPGVKIDGGLVAHLASGVDIHCLAKNLPEYLEVDISSLHAGESLHLSDIKLPEGVEIPALAQGPDHDVSIVSIVVKKGGEEEEVEAEEKKEVSDEGAQSSGEES
ncbi:MAG: 50S ribosomal protein L25/general stress protein Ctc [Gammaproteobacteria bacterium]|jgi:large subunit ribosomal protein L25